MSGIFAPNNTDQNTLRRTPFKASFIVRDVAGAQVACLEKRDRVD